MFLQARLVDPCHEVNNLGAVEVDNAEALAGLDLKSISVATRHDVCLCVCWEVVHNDGVVE